MAGARSVRTRILALLLPFQLIQAQDLIVPNLTITIVGQGFEVAITDAIGITEVTFYHQMPDRAVKGNAEPITSSIGRRWVYHFESQLVVHNAINYVIKAIGPRNDEIEINRKHNVTNDDFKKACSPSQFKCNNSNCVKKTRVCDGQDNCGDGSDELNCGVGDPEKCRTTEFACSTGYHCIFKYMHCDDLFDCRDSTDEKDCAGPVVTNQPQPATINLNCGATLSLNCTATGVPTPVIYWTLGLEHLPDTCRSENLQTDGKVVGTLTCSKMTTAYSGNYICSALNSKGEANADSVAVIVKSCPADNAATKQLKRTDNDDSCKPTVTTVRGGKACSGQVIFEDQFEEFKTDLWQIEQYIPTIHPEYPFVSYQRLMVRYSEPLTTSSSSDQVISTSDSHLRISLKLQQSLPGYTNESIFWDSLNLSTGCTASAEACFTQASGADILPPVASGRITSSSFSFKYGIVYIRAKLPQGDWIYPEILLEPLLNKYGRSHYASGVIRIVSARGNKELRAGSDEYGNKVLYGGPMMDLECRHELLRSKIKAKGRWGDDFHEYSVKWTPDEITLSVDGEEWARVDATRPLRERIPLRCTDVPRSLLSAGTNLAPFDDFFHVTLGVAVGGITEFRDDSYSGLYGEDLKPWRNSGRKAMFNFWQDLPTWHRTWAQPALLVDYVKVVAL